jgi:hypothetical protein
MAKQTLHSRYCEALRALGAIQCDPRGAYSVFQTSARTKAGETVAVFYLVGRSGAIRRSLRRAVITDSTSMPDGWKANLLARAENVK